MWWLSLDGLINEHQLENQRDHNVLLNNSMYRILEIYSQEEYFNPLSQETHWCTKSLVQKENCSRNTFHKNGRNHINFLNRENCGRSFFGLFAKVGSTTLESSHFNGAIALVVIAFSWLLSCLVLN
jgi:hypothetical protein